MQHGDTQPTRRRRDAKTHRIMHRSKSCRQACRNPTCTDPEQAQTQRHLVPTLVRTHSSH
eukprot:3468268-Prorocentrum_lima.AAC.1